jgi:excisionase family DNA binding protein
MDTNPHNGSPHRDDDATYSPVEAGRVLGVSDERIRQLIDAGEIEGEKRAGRWRVLKASVHHALETRGSPRRKRSPETVEDAAHEAAELRARVEDLAYRLGRSEAKAELTEIAESTVRESLERERERADRMEEEMKELRERLEESRREAGRSWWRQIFGG